MDEAADFEDLSDDRLVDLIRQARAADGRRAELLTNPAAAGSEMHALEKAISAGTEAVSVLFHRYLYVVEKVRRQYRIPRRGAGVRGMAGDDFAQDVFEKLRRSWAIATYDGAAPFGRWYLTVVRNAHFDVRRRTGKEPRVVDTPPGERTPATPTSDPPDQLGGGDNDSRLRVALRGLPANYRAPFLLAHLDSITLGPEDLELIARESNRSLIDVIDCERDFHERVLGPRRQRIEMLKKRHDTVVAELEEAQIVLAAARKELDVLECTSSVPRRSWLALDRRITEVRRRIAALIKRRERLAEELSSVTRVPSTEIARVLRITPNTVDQRLSRAWKLLREHSSED